MTHEEQPKPDLEHGEAIGGEVHVDEVHVDDAVAGEANEPEPVVTEHAPIEVQLQRSVRYGPIMISFAVLGAVAGAVLALLFPVTSTAFVHYELSQAVGLALVFGAVIGLAAGGVVALLLGIVARRSRGAALAVQTDVR